MTKARIGTLAAVAAFLITAACAPLPRPVPAPQPLPGRQAALDRMAVIISSTIARKDTEHPVFHGCLDWHSAVHGHWALLRIARATGDRDALARQAELSLDAAGLQAEAKTLREKPDFEMPYGRAWFLRLAIEFELWSRQARGSDPMRLRPMADEIARSILSYYDRYPATPHARTYHNASWAMVQLHDYYRFVGDAEGSARVARRLRESFIEGGQPGFAADAGSPEFFSPLGNWAYLVAKTQDAAVLGRFLDRARIADKDLASVEKLIPYTHESSRRLEVYPHHLGMNWSRAWAFKRLSLASSSPRDRERFASAYRSHVETGLKHHDLYAGDFGVYDHWVPQFAVYALTEGDLD